MFNSANKFRHTQVFCDVRRPCITLPGPRGIRRYEFKLHKSESEKECLNLVFIKQLLTKKGEHDNFSIRRKCVYTFNALIANCWFKKKILLAGDAAHQTPPFAGQGMNSGVRDALNLLKSEDLVISFPKKGTFVFELSSKLFFDIFDDVNLPQIQFKFR